MTTIHNGLESSLGLIPGSADKTQATQSTSADQTSQQAQVSATSQPSEVDITPTAQALASLEQQLASTPDIDQSRVDSISKALSNGTYKIDAARIADGVLAAQNFDAQASAGTATAAQSHTVKAYGSY